MLGLSRPRRRHGELRHVGAGGVTGQPWAREPSPAGLVEVLGVGKKQRTIMKRVALSTLSRGSS